MLALLLAAGGALAIARVRSVNWLWSALVGGARASACQRSLDKLERRRDRGEIDNAEYEAIRRQLIDGG